jgi:muramoyltetrapeptide carboxypeptidase
MIKIGIVAPGRKLTLEAKEAVEEIATASGLPIEIVVHPQCFLDHGHFAGPDEARLEAFLDFANDPGIDAIWFARGGYGAARLLAGLPSMLASCAFDKVYLGYSDAGFLLAALSRLGCRYCAHGPLVADVLRTDGAATITRALGFLSRTDASGLDPNLGAIANLAFNLTILRTLLGTDWLPLNDRPLGQSVLWLEDVAEYAYATDRNMFQLANNEWFKRCAGVRLGRFSLVPENDVAFPITSEQAVAQWCTKAGVPIIGTGDIGHDADNKIVPFGLLSDWHQAGLIP